jgi:hypothetical protein
MPVEAVKVSGLNELRRDFRRVEKGLAGALRTELKELAGEVATAAQAIALAKGLRKSGDHVKGIRPGVRGTTAVVRAIATHRGFNYPRRLEFESGGKRAVLQPALQAKRAEVEERVERLVDRTLDRHNL